MAQKTVQLPDPQVNSEAPPPFYNLMVFAKLLLPPVLGFGVLAMVLRYIVGG